AGCPLNLFKTRDIHKHHNVSHCYSLCLCVWDFWECFLKPNSIFSSKKISFPYYHATDGIHFHPVLSGYISNAFQSLGQVTNSYNTPVPG
uniref:Uncharacterized protein n=1 Tax=Seriola lalandi dorsalis TaxID=1841481 RepID=A0A3B4XHX6_SERLL